MRLQGIPYGVGCRFVGMPVILKAGGGSMRLGKRVCVNSSFLSNLIGLYQRTIIFARDGGVIEIGDDVGISGATIYARSSIKIGDGTLIGGNTKILDNDFHPVDADVRRENPNAAIPSKPIVIGKNVFIGCNCLILKGVTIGDDAVIGAGSVVTKDVPAGCVAAGNPAKDFFK